MANFIGHKSVCDLRKVGQCNPALSLPTPNIAEVISHPLYAWKKSIEFPLVDKYGGLGFL
jgi:hypothetical protein